MSDYKISDLRVYTPKAITPHQKLKLIEKRIQVARLSTGNLCCHSLMDWLISDVYEKEGLDGDE